jgi:hypothetical protein
MIKDGNPVNDKAPNVNAEKPEGSELQRGGQSKYIKDRG